jgi:hypothetical protein
LRQRIRVVYGRTGDLRFLSQLDVVRTVERSVRRSGLKVAFTEGFNPRVRLSFSPALPTGVEAEGAWFEVVLEEPTPLVEIGSRLGAALPEGFGPVEAVPAGGGREGPVTYSVRRADGAGAPADRRSVEALRGEAGRVPGLLDAEWQAEAIRIRMSPSCGGARLREALALLGLTGPDAPPVVVRARLGDSPLVIERTNERTDGGAPEPG